MEYRDIGENIRKYRNRLDLTQDELADKVGVTWEMISRYERGQSSPMNKLDKLANALNIKITDLIDSNLSCNYEIPLFTQIPRNFSFTKENTTLYYNCPKWLFNLDPEVFVMDSGLVDKKHFLSNEKGYLFLSPNFNLINSDLVVIQNGHRLEVQKYKFNGQEVVGKVMMQEIILL